MFINGVPIESYGGIMLGTPRISNAEYTSEYTYQRTRSTIRHLSHDIGVKDIECHVAFLGDSIHEIQLKRSAFRAALAGKLDVSFKRDRFFYFAEYDGERELESEHENAAVSVFKFKGVQHLPLETISGRKVFCKSTIPETDCRITVKLSASKTNVIIGGVKFASASANDVLVVDGFDGHILKNNQAVTAEFIRLPYLVSGENTVHEYTSGIEYTTIEYYPTFL